MVGTCTSDKMHILLMYFEIIRLVMIALALLGFTAVYMVGCDLYRGVPEQTPKGVSLEGKGTP